MCAGGSRSCIHDNGNERFIIAEAFDIDGTVLQLAHGFP